LRTINTIVIDNLLNRRLVLSSRPVGIPTPAHFRRDDPPVGELAYGQFLIRNRFLSVDPAQRGWVNASSNYSDPVPISGVMRALAVGEVIASLDPAISVGDCYYGWFGWQDYCACTQSALLAKVDAANGPLSAALGIFGITGITAYLALQDIGLPVPGETVLVSTAAGAVGSIVGQIARRLGCHVVGLTGTDDKVKRCVAEFGYHAALNYRQDLEFSRLKTLCPHGVDVYFDNTSGEISDAVWPHLNVRARVVQCGTAAIANWEPQPAGPRRDREILTKRLTHKGFIIFDHVARFPPVIAQLAEWVRDGSLRYREDIVDGLDSAPAALESIYRGDNSGKKIIRL
jgi:NADPH-dependent curcumin reductase CurA